MDSESRQKLRATLHQINNHLFVVSGKIEILLRERKLFKNINPDLKMLAEQTEEVKKLIDILFQELSKE